MGSAERGDESFELIDRLLAFDGNQGKEGERLLNAYRSAFSELGEPFPSDACLRLWSKDGIVNIEFKFVVSGGVVGSWVCVSLVSPPGDAALFLTTLIRSRVSSMIGHIRG